MSEEQATVPMERGERIQRLKAETARSIGIARQYVERQESMRHQRTEPMTMATFEALIAIHKSIERVALMLEFLVERSS